jgi:hypothetical protein
MNEIFESENYTAKYRAVLREKQIKLFTANDAIMLSSQVNFDIQSEQKSALDYFATAILGGILASTKAIFAQHHADILELEGKIWLNLTHPLTLLNVRGYETPPKISESKIKIYISSDLEEAEFAYLTNKALENSFVYHTLKNAFPFEIDFEQVL